MTNFSSNVSLLTDMNNIMNNNNNNMIYPIYMNNNLMMNNNMNIFSNRELNNYNQIGTKDEKLIHLFNFISFEQNNNYNFPLNDNNSYKSKIIINYYNIKKFDIYLNLELKLKEILPFIFWKIFYPSNYIMKYKRTKKNETTEYIIKNPKKIPVHDYFIKYQNILYLEFKNKNLYFFDNNKTCEEIGLKENDEILLKVHKDLYVNLFKNLNFQIILNYQGETKVFNWYNENDIKLILQKIFNKDKCKLLFNSKNILEDENVELANNCVINLINFYAVGGITPIIFVNVSQGKIKELKLSKNAPKWRLINEGLNIFGICQNSKCKAYNKEVVYRTNLTEKGLIFNINDNLINIICPICEKIIKPKTCGFYKC